MNHLRYDVSFWLRLYQCFNVFIFSNTLEEFLDKFEKAPAGFETYLSSGMLLATAETQPTLINKCEYSVDECCPTVLLGNSIENIIADSHTVNRVWFSLQPITVMITVVIAVIGYNSNYTVCLACILCAYLSQLQLSRSYILIFMMSVITTLEQLCSSHQHSICSRHSCSHCSSCGF